MTALTEVSTFGWFAADGTKADLLTSISTFGWYGVEVSLVELIDFFQTVDFGLIIDQLHQLGLEIEVIHELESQTITTAEQLGSFEITQVFNMRLKR
jgi:hypothetical protein